MTSILSLPLVRYVMKAAVRDRMIISLLLLVVLGACLSVFLGSAAVSESDQFALVYAAGGLRIAGVVGLVLFVAFYLRRAFDSKDVEYMLTRPVSRPVFLLSHAAAFILLAIVMAVCVNIAVFVVAPHHIDAGHVMWAVSLVSEFIIMVSAALFFAMVLSSAAASVMATLGLYVLARLMGQLLGIAATAGTTFYDLPGYDIMKAVFKAASLIIPRLDLMAQTSWLVYEPEGIGYLFIGAQLVLYTAFILSAALVDLVRRQF